MFCFSPLNSLVCAAWVVSLSVVWTGGLTAQTKTVDSGELRFANPAGLTPDEAKQWVVEQARIRALADAFGTRVQSETVMSVTEANGTVDDAFTELSVSQVKGEWLQTLEVIGPTAFVQDNDFWWTVRIRGKARPLRETRVELDFALVEDVQARIPLESLAHGDRIRCGFISPVDGHAMFFYVESGTVYVLAEDPTAWAAEVEGQQRYSLFTPSHEWREADVPEMMSSLEGYAYGFQALNPGDVDVQGMLIAAFSTERFSPPIAEGQSEISTLGEADFERWIKRKSGASDAFQVERQPVRIRAKKSY